MSRLLEHGSLCRKLFELQRLELNEALFGIGNTAAAEGLDVVFRWAPREQLVDATALSRLNDRHDFNLTEAGLGFWDVDRLAAAHSSKAPRFDSSPQGAEAVDAFAQSIVG